MVFSSIKPEKRFTQRREKERESGGEVASGSELFLLRVEGGEGGGGLNCVRQMRRARGAASAMCCTDTQTSEKIAPRLENPAGVGVAVGHFT